MENKIIKVVGEVVTFADGSESYLPFEDFGDMSLLELNRMYNEVMKVAQNIQIIVGGRHMKNCVLCSRYTKNRKIFTVSNTGKTGVVCSYCKEHGRIEANDCKPVSK